MLSGNSRRGGDPQRLALRNWHLRPALKYASSGVVRTVAPAETIKRIAPLMPVIGVTRIADVTHLDRIGIPNFTTVRPRDYRGISYYNGKGATRLAAKAGAMMEAIERYCGERCDLEICYGSYREMRRRGAAVDPGEIIAPRFREYRPNVRLEWVEGFDLIARRPTYVPLNSVVQPYEPQRGSALYYSSTNGLASGNTIEEALCHALCEVIERDAASISVATLELAPAVGRVLNGVGVLSSESAHATHDKFPLIALDSLPPSPTKLVHKMRAAKLRIYLRNLTSTAGIPTLECTIVEEQLDGRHLAHGGSGTHPDARVALTRALTEAAQSRVACMQGGREDLPEIIKERVTFDPDYVFGRGPVRPFSSMRSYEHERIDQDITFLLRRLKAEGFKQIVAVNLTRPELGVPVIRVVLPQAETWAVFYSHLGCCLFGERVKRILHGASPNCVLPSPAARVNPTPTEAGA
ncbi:MAG: methanogenesis marker 1 protein [Acidobacteria bacterium]|nr:MAG: methanogenesis marker 1 protein [Acidobacteriota bacterium]